MPEDATLLAFDYGTRRIGVAVGEARLGRARPLGAVANVNGTPDWAALDAHVTTWRPAALVIGRPLAEDGSEQPMTAHARGFAKRLRRRYERPVHAVDERFSSIEAGERLAALRAGGQRRRRASRDDVDALAAALILERWFAVGDGGDVREDGAEGDVGGADADAHGSAHEEATRHVDAPGSAREAAGNADASGSARRGAGTAGAAPPARDAMR